MILAESETTWLRRLVRNGGYLPDGPFLASQEAPSLMRKGLVEAIKPEPRQGRACGLPHVRLTSSGWDKASELGLVE